jgi:outer membrane protein assembly factor BamB
LHDDIVADLTAIDPKDGRVIWQRGFKGHLEEPQAVDSGLIITGAGEGGLWALREKDGTVVWHSDIGHADVTPLVVDDAVYAQAQPQGSKDASVFVALDRDSGAELWRLPLLGQPWGAPVYDVDRRMILTTSARGQIGVSRETDAGWAYGIYRPRRKIVWQKELPNMAVSPEVFLQDSGTVIYSLKNGELLALESATGNEVWRKKVGAQLQSPAILLEGEGEELLAVTSFEGVFSVLRARDGQLLAHYKVGKSVTSSPVSHNDFIYVTAAHTVRAFGPVSELRQARP